jgi:diguanylate cyclase (GGDEF)-like protein
MIKLHPILWIVVLLLLRGFIELLPIPSGHDFFRLIVTLFILGLAVHLLGFRSQLNSFLLGVIFIVTAGVLDWFDDLLTLNPQNSYIMDVMDDLLLAAGIFFLGLSFIKVMLERDKLEEKLYRQAYVDELTGLGNRRALFQKLDEVIHTHSGALLYIDVNNFKQVNDRYGHDQGDLVLRACASLISSCQGYGYRLGGDEFVILLMSNEYPQVILDQLQQGIAPLYVEHGIGLSIGVVLFDGNTFSDPDALISQADKAMYLQKQSIRIRGQRREQPNN